MIERLVLFGATGDLAGRYLLPALAALHAAGELPEGFEIVGAAREELDDDAFRQAAASRLAEHAAETAASSHDAVVRALRYRPTDVADLRSVAALFDTDSPAAAYLALPPSLFPAAVTALLDAGVAAGSRIVLETLALEGRAGYYDTTGALRDVMQNHMLQVLSLVAMELPRAPRGARPARPQGRGSARDPAARARRGRAANAAGSVHRRPVAAPPQGSGETVPAYADEHGVDRERQTETFAEVVLELAGERWADVRFVLRAGKALARRRKVAVLRFRDPMGRASRTGGLRIGIDGPEDVVLQLSGGAPQSFVPLELTAPAPAAVLPPYARVVLDVLTGGTNLSVRGDEAEERWRVVTPVLDAWSEGLVPLEEYPAGSTGPPPLASR